MNSLHFPSRRQMLQRSGFGMGAIAAAAILAEESRAEAAKSPLSSRPPHYPARAKQIIHVFANGGPSQIDMFDPKPALSKLNGKKLDSADKSNR